MKLKRLIICVVSILIMSCLALSLAACGVGPKTTTVDVDIDTDNVDEIPAGEYALPYSIDDMDTLVRDHGLTVTFQVTNNYGKDVPVTDGKINVIANATYNVVITATLSDGTQTKASFTIKSVKVKETFTIKYFSDISEGALPFDTKTVVSGDLAPSIAIPTKVGYAFSYWYLSTDSKQEEYTSAVTSNISLFAKFSLVEYTVTFDADGGEIAQNTSKSSILNDYIITPQIPVKRGYVFKYWYLTGDATKTNIDFSTYKVIKDIAVTAEYVEDTYTITFVCDDENFLSFTKTTDINRDFKLDGVTSQVLPDKTFVNWKRANGTGVENLADEKFYEDETVTAIYTNKSLKITFILDKNIPTEIFGITYSQKNDSYKIILPTNQPTKAYYNLDGWFRLGDEAETLLNIETTILDKNETLVAKWSEKQYIATFNYDILGIENATTSTTISEKFKIAPPDAPTKTGYIFRHWYLSTDIQKAPFDFAHTEVKENITLSAKYDLDKIKVTFFAENPITKEKFFTRDIETDIEQNYRVTAPKELACEGFILDFFYDFDAAGGEANAIPFNFSDNSVRDGAKFKAKMKPLPYTVIFYDRKNPGAPYIEDSRADGNYNGVTLPDLKNWDNYDTKGWRRTTDTSGEIWTNTTIIHSSMLTRLENESIMALKLYSSRTIIEYDVSFVYTDNDGKEQTLGAVRKGTSEKGLLEKVTELPIAPDKTYYAFQYWYILNGTTETKVDMTNINKLMFTSDTKIYANYKRQECKIDFYLNLTDTSPFGSLTKDYDYELTQIDYPKNDGNAPFTKEGYVDNNGIWGRLVGGVLVPISASEKLTTNENFYLIWELITHKVTVNVTINGVSKDFVTTISILTNNLFKNPEAQISSSSEEMYIHTKGNRLLGLYRDSAFTDNFVFATEQITADIALFAKYVNATVNLNFYKNPGDTTATKELNLSYNSDFSGLPSFSEYSKEQYVTLGWGFFANGDVSGTMTLIDDEFIANSNNRITSDMDLYVYYAPVTHTIIIKTNNGQSDIILKTTHEVGYNITAPILTRYGFIFKEWKKGTDIFDFSFYIPVDKNVAETIEINAVWTMVEYSVVFETAPNNTETLKINYFTDFIIASPPKAVKPGYTFVGWTLNQSTANPFDFSVQISSNIKLYAMFSKQTFTVTFRTEDGNIIKTIAASIDGLEQDLPIQTKLHYDFIGWYDSANPSDNTLYEKNSQYLKDITLKPKFKPIDYKITFETGLPTITIDPYYTSINSNFVVERPMISVPNKILEGWYLTRSGTAPNFEYSNLYNFHTPLSSHTTLYAKWRDQSETDGNFIFEEYSVKEYDVNGQVILKTFKALIGLSDIGKAAYDLTIPANINSVPVGEIRANAFSGSQVRTVTIKSNVRINGGAFSNATNLDAIYVTYSDKIIDFQDILFLNCINLSTVFVPTSLFALYAEQFSFPNSVLRSADEFGNELLILDNVTYFLTKTAAFVKSYPTDTSLLGSVIIPRQIYGVPVRFIMDSAFKGCYFDSITLPDSIYKIGNYAFQDCPRLNEIRVPSSVREIGSLAFGNCGVLFTAYFDSSTPPTITDLIFSGTQINSIFVPEDLVSAYKLAYASYATLILAEPRSKTIVIYMVNGGEKLNTKYYDADNSFPEDITPVRFGYTFEGWFKDNAFSAKIDFKKSLVKGSLLMMYANWKLDTTVLYQTKDIIVRNSIGTSTDVMIIGLSDYAKTLKSLTIPSMIGGKKVRYIQYSAFIQSEILEEIKVEDGNEYFVAEDGVLFTAGSEGGIKTPLSLVSFPMSKKGDALNGSYEIPSGVKSIEQYAFSNNKYLKSIFIPKEVAVIGAYAFSESAELSKVTIGDKSNLTEISDGVFSQCKKLESFRVPELVVAIKSAAFYNCVKLLSLEFTAKIDPVLTIASSAFSPATTGDVGGRDIMIINTIILPTGCGELYATVLDDIKISAEKEADSGFIDWQIIYK